MYRVSYRDIPTKELIYIYISISTYMYIYPKAKWKQTPKSPFRGQIHTFTYIYLYVGGKGNALLFFCKGIHHWERSGEFVLRFQPSSSSSSPLYNSRADIFSLYFTRDTNISLLFSTWKETLTIFFYFSHYAQISKYFSCINSLPFFLTLSPLMRSDISI